MSTFLPICRPFQVSFTTHSGRASVIIIFKELAGIVDTPAVAFKCSVWKTKWIETVKKIEKPLNLIQVSKKGQPKQKELLEKGDPVVHHGQKIRKVYANYRGIQFDLRTFAKSSVLPRVETSQDNRIQNEKKTWWRQCQTINLIISINSGCTHEAHFSCSSWSTRNMALQVSGKAIWHKLRRYASNYLETQKWSPALKIARIISKQTFMTDAERKLVF